MILTKTSNNKFIVEGKINTAITIMAQWILEDLQILIPNKTQSFKISDKPMEGALELEYAGIAPFGTWYKYNKTRFWFCDAKIQDLFSCVPETIYFKELSSDKKH